MKHSIVWKFFGAFVCLTLIAVFVLYYLVGSKLQDNFEQKILRELRSNVFGADAGRIVRGLKTHARVHGRNPEVHACSFQAPHGATCGR